MCTSKAKNLPTELLNFDDEDEEKKKIIEFYETSYQFLMTYPVQEVEYDVIRQIAVMLEAKLNFTYDWRGYATKMGITNSYELDVAEASAKAHNDQPIFFAMYKRNGYFGQIIKALLSTEKYDVLRAIEPYVKGLVQSHSRTGVKRLVSVEKQYFGSLHSDPKEQCTIKLNSASMNEHKNEFNSFQQCFVDKCSKNAFQIYSTPESSEPSSRDHSEEMKVIPSAPNEEKLSVLIQHTEFDDEYARRLSAMLREERFIVLTLSDLETMSNMDPMNTLATVYQEVDFVVPIVSDRFLQQIYPQNYDIYLESTYAKNNRCLYRMITTEYANNRCLNFKVRPVIVPEMNRRQLVREVILSYALRLWNEVPTLVKALKDTKKSQLQQLVR